MLKEKIKDIKGISVLVFIFFLWLVQTEVYAFGDGNWKIDGFIRNNTGFWTENWDYSKNNDPLATCRNWLRLNLNGRISDSLSLKSEVLAVYETEYARERYSGVPANEYNSFDFRELRLDWSPTGGQTISIGRQIVNWGEALSARVGDVINPVDNRFDLGFTNLEDTRIPIWMVRGLNQFTTIGSSLDWIFAPYTGPDRYRVNRGPSSAGTVNSNGSSTPSPRFAAYPETRVEENMGTLWVPLGGSVVIPGSAAPLPLFGPPLSFMYTSLDNATANYLFPGPVVPDGTGGFIPITWGNNQSIPNGLVPNVTVDYPNSTLSDSRFGFKTSSSIYQWQTGIYFWHSNELDAVMRVKGGVPAFGTYLPGTPLNIVVEYPKQNVYGFYSNKNFDFGLIRIDAAYRPDRNYNTTDLAKYPEAIAEKNNLMFQLGFNKDMMIRKINPNQTFSFIIEYVGEYILNSDLDGIHVPTYFVPYHKDSHSIFLSTGTKYNYGMYGYDLIVMYNNRGSGMIQPKFTYKPEWMNRQWTLSLLYSNLFGKNNYTYPYGLVRDKDMVVFTVQYDF